MVSSHGVILNLQAHSKELEPLNWKTWNGINWLALENLMAITVFSPSFDWPKVFQSTVQLTHVKSF